LSQASRKFRIGDPSPWKKTQGTARSALPLNSLALAACLRKTFLNDRERKIPPFAVLRLVRLQSEPAFRKIDVTPLSRKNRGWDSPTCDVGCLVTGTM
jgi:hypothetical protein